MSRPEPGAGDTKTCPYCAETIKAAAIKCRYCQSDLTGTAAPPAPDREPGPVAGAPSPPMPAAPVTPPPARSARPTRRLDPRVSLAVLVLSLLLTLVFAGLALRDWREASELRRADEAGRTVQAVVTDKVEALLGYDHESFDKDLAEAERTMTASFRKEYAPTVEEIRDAALEQKRSQQAEVRAVGIVSESPEKVTALVFVDTVSTTEESTRQQVMQNRIKVTMVKDGDTWLIDDLTVPQS